MLAEFVFGEVPCQPISLHRSRKLVPKHVRQVRCRNCDARGCVNDDGLAFTLEFRVHVNDKSGSRVEEEFEALDLGDPRLDQRAKALLKRLAAKPSKSIRGACDSWGETSEPIVFRAIRKLIGAR
ncbi:transposase [Caballeronia sp. dw_19]|uniref:IS4/Tn5 family transposase DNA-binding protein n=1 Tax=unclassified Caballeronia TaxID=2646786 RepID=UPI0021040546|nr:transposase [Caballeronia sp. dw_19]